MYIDFDRLEENGYYVEYSKKGVAIHPKNQNPEIFDTFVKMLNDTGLSTRTRERLVGEFVENVNKEMILKFID